MTTSKTFRTRAEAEDRGVVGRLTDGRWGPYHRLECPLAPHRGEPGVRDTIHAPWRYLGAHWEPCGVCSPPAAAAEGRAA